VNLRRQLTRNVLSNWMFLFLNLVIFFFLTPFIIDVLGPARAGIWFLLGSITGYFGIVAFGIPGATEKYVAEYLANDDRDQVNRIVSSSLFLSLWLAVIAAAAAAALCVFVDNVFTVGREHLIEARWVMIIIGIDLALAYPCALMFNVLKGFNRYDVRNAILIPALLVKAGGYYLVLTLGGGVTAMVLVQLVVNLLGYLAATLWVRHQAPWLRVSLRARDRNVSRLVLVYGAFQFVAMAADRIILHTDRIIVASMVTMAGVTVYHLAAQLRNQGRQFSSGLTMALRPAASHLHALGDYANLQKLLIIGGRIMLVALGGLYVLYATWGDRFIHLWQYGLTKQDADVAYTCLMILIAPTFLTVALGPGVAIMYGMARHKPFGLLGLVVAVVNVGLSIWLARLIGIYGVAIGTAVPLFFIRGLYMYYYFPHITRMSPWRFIAGAWGRPLMGLVPLAAAMIVLRLTLRFDRLLWLMVFFAAVGCAYVAWVYLVVLTPEEKRLVHEIASGRSFKTGTEDTDS